MHCGPRNNGKYDALYTLTPAWHAEFAAFFGMEHFPAEQLVTRSVTGKAVYFIGAPVRALLAADSSAKLKLVNTGTRVLEKAEVRPGVTWHFKLAQEGAHCLVRHMTRQRLFVPTADLLDLLRRRTMPAAAFRSAAFREALAAASPGAIAIVHDAAGAGELVLGEPLPLVLAATRTDSTPPVVELVVKQQEAISLYNRTAHVSSGASAGGSAGASGAEAQAPTAGEVAVSPADVSGVGAASADASEAKVVAA